MLEFLSEYEVRQLTQRTRHGAQCRVLRQLGLPHSPRPGAHPAVLRSEVEALLGRAPRRRREPDWSALG
jgi:hypothetical protein